MRETARSPRDHYRGHAALSAVRGSVCVVAATTSHKEKTCEEKKRQANCEAVAPFSLVEILVVSLPGEKEDEEP